MKILICENEEILLAALEFRLQKNGFNIVWADNGVKGYEKAKEESPDLIITSLNLPKQSGLDMIKQIKSDKKDLPIIVVGELEQDDVIEEALKLGISDFLTKPFKPVELVIRVKHVLSMLN